MGESVILVLLLILSGVFSGSETALVAISMARVDALVKDGRRGAGALARLKRDPSRMLTTILIGNNVVNIGASVMATVISTRLFGAAGPGIAVGVLTLVILVFGEITPKSLATRFSERISLFIALPLLGFMRLIYPLVWIFGHFTNWVHRVTGGMADPVVTESELISMLDYGEREGAIEHEEREIIERVFSFNDLLVRDVMTPNDHIFSLDGELTIDVALSEVTRGTFSRIPLYETNAGNLKRVLFLRDLLEAVAAGKTGMQLIDIAHDLMYVPQQQKISELFQHFRESNRQFASVVDEYGTVRGVVTMEDLMEELVGEIYDESDAEPVKMVVISDDEISVDGIAEIRTVEEFFGIDLPGKPTDAVSFWVLSHVEYIPREREVFTIDGLEVEIIKASSRRIDGVSIRRPVSMD